jgi:hypothetical protein
MDRLMCLEVKTSGPPVEVAINGLPVLRLGEGAPPRCLPVHEYLLAGANRLSLTVAPPMLAQENAPPQPRMAASGQAAMARLLLMRQGHTPESPGARELGVVKWAVAEGESYEAPTTMHQDLDLPVAFPRWRWLDAPVMNPGPALSTLLLAWLQRLAYEISRGRPEMLVTASRLKLEELALAYQWPPGSATERLQAELQVLHEAKALAALQPPKPDEVIFRPVAGGRLIDCLSPLGEPALQIPTATWPLRVAVVDGNVYVLR